MPLTDYQRKRIISLYLESDTKKTPVQIQRIMQSEGVQTSYQTVQRTIQRWKETGNYKDRSRKGGVKRVLEEHYRFIDEAMSKKDELTASDLMDMMQDKFGHEAIRYSLRTLARARQDLGWTFGTARYCRAIRESNKLKRIEWCQQRLLEEENFNNVIFTDESTVQLENHRRKCFRRRGAPRKMKYKFKHPQKVHVWGGISKRGATKIVIFQGIMTATVYGDILRASLIPFIRKHLPDSHRLYQDNDPKHTSRYIRGFFEQNEIVWWKSPAESPDLNPIEKIWGSMKCYLRDKYKPKNLVELKSGIKAFWKKLTPDVCARYIDHLHKVLPLVIDEDGGPTGH